jgi:hypothetical protein
MSNIQSHPVPLFDDVPVVLFDRRRAPDRRRAWRGGRRDSDWLNRPPGALARLERNTLRWLTRWPASIRGDRKSA